MKTWFYSWVAYPIIYSAAALVGLANRKVRETLRLRSWKDFLSLRFNVGQPIEYWLHVASAGELEYAIPILEELGRRQKRVLVTYYSISAKRAVDSLPQKYPWVSLVVPLPHDGLGLMKEFVALVHRQGVRSLLLLKYELWPGLLWECNSHGVKVYLVDALKPSWFHKRLLHKLDGIFTGYESEVTAIKHKNVKVLGDTRVERVLQRVNQSNVKLDSVFTSKTIARISNEPTLVCGSMWPPDTRLIISGLALLKGEKLPDIIWVPHELTEVEAQKATDEFTRLGYGIERINDSSSSNREQVLSEKPLAVIVMRKGVLAELYKLGRAAYVGGGFGDGVHSVWEPALAGAVVSCGPKTERSPEAQVLAGKGALVELTTALQCANWIKNALAPGAAVNNKPQSLGEAIKEIIAPHLGAARRIVEFCETSSK